MLTKSGKWLLALQLAIISALVTAVPANAGPFKEDCTVANQLKGPLYDALGKLEGAVGVVGIVIGFVLAAALVGMAAHQERRSKLMSGLLWVIFAIILVASVPGILIALSGSKCV